MPDANIIKLAPTLSAEERFKMAVADVHRQMIGGKPILSISERQAITKCEDREMWKEYTRHIGVMQWAGAFWIKDIEAERLRVLVGSLILGRMLDRLVMDADMEMPESIRQNTFTRLKETVRMFEEQSELFYAYLEAITKIETKELYGTPLFDEKKRVAIADAYKMGDELFESYNERLTMLCQTKPFQEFLKPIAEHLEEYRAKKPVPKPESVDTIIREIMDIVESELEMLLR